MTIKDIRYFVEIVTQGSFTKAAEKLYISQPALSKSIKLLEHELDIQLIDRDTKGIHLTEKGRLLYENAQKSLLIVDLEMERLNDILRVKKECITIGLPPVIGTVYFPKILATYKQKYPYIDVNIVEKGANNIKNELIEEKIDVGAVIAPVKSSKLAISHMIYGEIIVAVDRKHRLAKEKNVSIEDLKFEKFVMFNETFSMYDKTVEVCNKYGFEPSIALKTSQWDFIMEMVALGEGITLMPKAILERFNTNEIVLVPIHPSAIKWNIAIVTKKDKYITRAAQLFINHIIQEIPI